MAQKISFLPQWGKSFHSNFMWKIICLGIGVMGLLGCDVLIPKNFPDVPVLPGNKAATFNETGYVFFDLSPLAETFLEWEALPNRDLLEIGAGFGNVPIEAIQRPINSYTVNDLSEDHLWFLQQRIRERLDDVADEGLRRLILLPGKAPEDLPKTERKYDAILIDKVLHFMSPEEIEVFLKWCQGALKRGGRLYVTTVSPYTQIFKDKVLPIYQAGVRKADLFPAYIQETKSFLDSGKMTNYPQYAVPQAMTFFARPELGKLLEAHGFHVIKSYSFQIPTETTPWRLVEDQESGLAGVIAELRG